MAMQVDIGKIGENIVGQWLRDNGYTKNVDTKLPGSTDIEAKGRNGNRLVQVKTAITPNEPASLSSDEVRNITSRATRLGCEAWEAKVQLGANYELVGNIRWRKLN
jgi:hypothetical protein